MLNGGTGNGNGNGKRQWQWKRQRHIETESGKMMMLDNWISIVEHGRLVYANVQRASELNHNQLFFIATIPEKEKRFIEHIDGQARCIDTRKKKQQTNWNTIQGRESERWKKSGSKYSN